MVRKRYIVCHNGRAIGWVHAANQIEAIKRVAKMTKKPAEECAALIFAGRKPMSSQSSD